MLTLPHCRQHPTPDDEKGVQPATGHVEGQPLSPVDHRFFYLSYHDTPELTPVSMRGDAVPGRAPRERGQILPLL